MLPLSIGLIIFGVILTVIAKSIDPFLYFLILGCAGLLFELIKFVFNSFGITGLTSALIAFSVFCMYLLFIKKLTKKLKF
ncbi:hypothetical protein CD29_05550 [Ureibacillus manganicus DSM 26584]|uniref:Uncharacterized protein n=1 Tax=Ureibacillus manganicus DSM 26584 TaxID=1384049 RepID=A0A0A3I497_9BACL|nr:hypothetical protein CD29_05550 [Ureibacillus manganicus DSM 26584]